VAVGGHIGLLFFGDIELEEDGDHGLKARLVSRAGRRCHLAVQFIAPEEIDGEAAKPEPGQALAAHYDETLAWWQGWAARLKYPAPAGTGIVRSAVVLKALTYAPTGAIVAAPTTSLPEKIGGERNWDYRYSWVRDSIFTVRELSALGLEAEADAFRGFIQRSAAGHPDNLRVMYGIDGRRRLTEFTLDHLEGWRGSRPVRIGNGASTQYQADMYGLILELSWRWSEQGREASEAYWSFLQKIVEAAIERWPDPDRGIWEVRSRPRHFVQSKVMCWAAIDRGIGLAERHSLEAPLARWRTARDALRTAIERRGVDRRRGVFVRSFGSTELDASLLLLPAVRFVSYEDPRMRATADAIHRELCADGLVLRYRADDGLEGREGAFIACTFWLATVLARQGRRKEALELFERACGCASDLGLFPEEYDPKRRELIGNYPQGLTHLAHVAAALAIYADDPQRIADD
jgi:GH15 family glucan-1,4-alpha-glucosidase